MFWGKHSLLSILSHEQYDKADHFFDNGISSQFLDIFMYINTISCKINLGSIYERHTIELPNGILNCFDHGIILPQQMIVLDNTERMLKLFFSSICKEIKGLYYRKENVEDGVRYQLVLNKSIAGKDRAIDFSMESAGTKALLDLLPYILLSEYGVVTIVDEFEMGLHDSLVKNIILSMYTSIHGQIILTSHNTNLMESDLPKECFYIVNLCSDGSTTIEPITSYDHKIHKNTNIKNQYLSSSYSGLPNIESLNFHSLLEQLDV